MDAVDICIRNEFFTRTIRWLVLEIRFCHFRLSMVKAFFIIYKSRWRREPALKAQTNYVLFTNSHFAMSLRVLFHSKANKLASNAFAKGFCSQPRILCTVRNSENGKPSFHGSRNTKRICCSQILITRLRCIIIIMYFRLVLGQIEPLTGLVSVEVFVVLQCVQSYQRLLLSLLLLFALAFDIALATWCTQVHNILPHLWSIHYL